MEDKRMILKSMMRRTFFRKSPVYLRTDKNDDPGWSEETVLENEQGFTRQHLDELDTIFLVLSPDMAVRWINRKGCDIVGAGRRKILGGDWLEFAIPSNYRQILQNELHRLIYEKTESVSQLEIPILSIDNQQLQITWNFSTLKNEEGNINGIIGIGYDISGQNHIVENQPGNEATFKTLFHRSNDLILLYDLDGNILDVNETTVNKLGFSRQELLKLKMENLYVLFNDNWAKIQDAFRIVYETGSHRYTAKIKKKDGSQFSADVSASMFMLNGTTVIQEIWRDAISTELAAKEADRMSEQKYLKFIEDDLTGDFIASPEGQIMFCNQSFLNITGFENVQKVTESDAAIIFSGRPDWDELLAHVREKKKLENCEIELTRKNGSKTSVVSNLIGEFDPSGKLIEIKGYLYDNSEHKKTIEQLQQAQKMEAIGRLAGGVAHDFNNLLSVINGYSELILKNANLSKITQNYLEQIHKAGNRAASLTGQLLAFSRRQVLHPAILNLNHLVRNLQKMLQRLIGENIELKIQTGKKNVNIKADPGQIEQVILNLAVNARDAMPMGGKLTIESAGEKLSKPVFREQVTMPAGEYAVLTVRDNGTGMTEQIKSRIFEPFFTTKEKGKGTGLGLSTVYGIIKQSEGFIWVDSETGRGTSFTIYLPRVREKAKKQIVRSDLSDSRQGNETILVVEDDEGVRELSRIILTQQGYRVITAVNGEEALGICRQLDDPVDLLITDVILPGFSGKRLAQQLMRIHPNLQVLYISGYNDEAIIHHGVFEPGVLFLKKPFGSRELLVKVAEVLEAGENN